MVRVLQHLVREIGLRSWKGAGEVRGRLPFPAVKAALDLVDEHAAAPAVLDRGTAVPRTLFEVFDLFDQNNLLAPRQRRYGRRESSPRVSRTACARFSLASPSSIEICESSRPSVPGLEHAPAARYRPGDPRHRP